MPKVTTIKCPECAAPLKVPEGVTRTTCEYCGSTVSLQATRQMPAAAEPPRPGAGPSPVRRPVRRRGFKGPVIAGVAVMLVLGGVLVLTMKKAGPRIRTPGRSGGPVSSKPVSGKPASGGNWSGLQQWSGGKVPILQDVNDDGQPEVFGWMRSPGGREGLFLVGLDVAAHKPLWEVRVLASTDQESKVLLAFAGGKLLVADPLGVLTAYAPHNGQVVFKTTLGERTERFCAGEGDRVIVELSDRRRIGVDPATGQAAPLKGKARPGKPCGYVVTNLAGETAAWRLDGRPFSPHPDLPAVRGMEVERMLVDEQGGVDFPLGVRSPGTAVPTAAARDRASRKILWMTDVPTADPLTVAEKAPEQAALADGKLLVPYRLSDGRAPWRLACLDAGTGKSLWDVEVPNSDFIQGPVLLVANGRIYAGIWTMLDVFDLKTGRLLTTVGQW